MALKPALTAVCFVCLAMVAAVVIAVAIVDERDAGGYGARQAWLSATVPTVGSVVSRGLAKSGRRDRYTEDAERVAHGDALSTAGPANADPSGWTGGSAGHGSAVGPAQCDAAFSRSDSDHRRSCWELRLADARRSGDPRERAALIEEYLPLARSLAWRLRTSRASPDDLVQVACLGLVKAVDRFDPERGQRFSSFAVPTITGELRRYQRDRTWRLHIARSLQNLIVALGPVTDALTSELQRSPMVDELAKRMRVSPEAILDARQAGDSQFDHSLDEPAHEDARESLAETLGREDPELARADRIEGWLAELPEREREILRLRFEEDLTQSEIAEQFAISQMHVSRLLTRSLEHLQAMAIKDEERSALEPDPGQAPAQGDEDRQVRLLDVIGST